MTDPPRPLDPRGKMLLTDPAFVDIRGRDGRLYGRIDLDHLILEVRKGGTTERIDLTRLRDRKDIPL